MEHPPSPSLWRSPRRQAPNAILGKATPMVAEAHKYKWYLDPSHIMFDVQGPVRYREWGIRTVTGDILHAGCNLEGRFSRLEIFLLMFPPHALESILEATNQQLHLCNKRRTTRQELLKFFGIVILATRYEFMSRASLWSTEPTSKYKQAANFSTLVSVRSVGMC